MRALVYDRYGSLDVLQIRDVERPAPGPGELLVRVHAAALNPKDSFVRKGRFRAVSGRHFPKYVGADFAGEVVSVGSTDARPSARSVVRTLGHAIERIPLVARPKLPRLSAGTPVFGMLQEWTYARGTVAEYVVVDVNEVAPMPASLDFAEAAALPLVASTALQALRDVAGVRSGDAICIHGASGGVGTAAVQIAKALGAVVTTTSSEANRALCLALGADEALDYTNDAPFSGARKFRVILDAFGNQSLARTARALAKDGVYVTTVPSARIVADAARTLFRQPRARLVVVRPRRADLLGIAELVASGRLRAVVDRRVPFDEAVSGVQHLETKRTRGKIVVTIDR